jgi:hypothetical protein
MCHLLFYLHVCALPFRFIYGHMKVLALYSDETWTIRKVDQIYLESFEMWCWRRMEKVRWTDCVKNEEVLRRVKEERTILIQ